LKEPEERKLNNAKNCRNELKYVRSFFTRHVICFKEIYLNKF